MPSSHAPSPNGSPETNGHGSVHDLLYGDTAPRRSSQLHDLIETLWSGKWIILGVLVLVVAAAAIYTYSLPTTYRTSSLLLVDRNSQTSVLSGLGQGRSSPFLRRDQTLQNELLILRQSRTIARRVAKRLQKMGTHPDTGAPLQILRGPNGERRSTTAVAGRVQGITSAQPSGEETDALYISATSNHAYEAGLVANLYAKEYIRRTREKSREDLKASRQFLEQQAQALKKDLEAADAKVENYVQTHEAVSLDQASSRVVGRISDLEARRSELKIKLDMKRAALKDLETALADAEPRLAERLSSSLDKRLQRVQKEKAELEARIDAVERRNPGLNGGGTRARELRQMRRRADRLQRKADSLARAYVDQSLRSGAAEQPGAAEGGKGGTAGVGAVIQKRQRASQLRIDIRGLEAQLDVVDRRLAEQRSKLKSIPRQSMELAQLQRERRSTEKIYSFVQEKLQEARLAEQSEMGYAEIIRPAGPGRPMGPDTRQNLMLALVLGLVLGGGLVVLREQLDTRIHQPADLRDHGHSVIGAVPSMTPLIDNEFDGQKTVTIDGQALHTTLAMVVSPMSAPAEAYRRVRTNLQFARPDDAVRTLAVSSPGKGAGKTTTSSNLGLALASAGERTVIVDADLRRPWLHNLFGVDQEPGLSTTLYEDAPSLDAFATDIDHLSVIPAGAEVPNPSELLGSTRMKAFLGRLEEQFDYVIVDTPPVLLFSDMLGLAPHCDGTLLVARAEETDGHAFDHTVERLRDVGADPVGCVLNAFDASSVLYTDGSNYGYTYAYRRLQDYYEEDDRTLARTRISDWWNG
ncbi:MAG: polysaccharide biosynthesis tyrosine autokinase [Salinibacter sp.]